MINEIIEIFVLILNYSLNNIGDEGTKELALRIKSLINLNKIKLILEYI